MNYIIPTIPYLESPKLYFKTYIIKIIIANSLKEIKYHTKPFKINFKTKTHHKMRLS